MTETHEVEAGEKSLDELIHLLEAGDRIIVKNRVPRVDARGYVAS